MKVSVTESEEFVLGTPRPGADRQLLTSISYRLRRSHRWFCNLGQSILWPHNSAMLFEMLPMNSDSSLDHSDPRPDYDGELSQCTLPSMAQIGTSSECKGDSLRLKASSKVKKNYGTRVLIVTLKKRLTSVSFSHFSSNKSYVNHLLRTKSILVLSHCVNLLMILTQKTMWNSFCTCYCATHKRLC